MTDASSEDAGPVAVTILATSYAVAFSEVWDAVLGVISSLRGWEAQESDSRSGTIRVATLHPLGYRPLSAAVRLWLDELGQTRLEIRFDEPRHPLMRRAAPRRARRFLLRVDRALGIRRRP